MQSLGMINFWTFLIGSVFVITIPGPNMLYVLSVSAQRGVRHAYRAVCGIFLGDSILMTLSAAGVASLLKAYPILFFVSFFIQFVDPAYPYPALSFLALGAIDQLISLSYLSLLIFTGVRLSE